MPDHMRADARSADVPVGPPEAGPSGPLLDASGGAPGVATAPRGLAARTGANPATDTRLLEVLVHDLRSPLNTIKLAMHGLSDVPSLDPELGEDVAMIARNLGELERMLTVVADFSQLPCEPGRLRPATFDLGRLVRELAEVHGEAQPHLRLSTDTGVAPVIVELDPTLAAQALRAVLENAIRAAGDGPGVIRLALHHDPAAEGCRLEVRLESPPPDSVQAAELRPDSYRKLLGNAAERRGLDLAVAARITHLFGGQCRLDLEPGVRSTVRLEWPTRLSVGAGEPLPS